MIFKIVYRKTAADELLKLPSNVAHRVRKAINELAVNPHPSGSLKLRNLSGFFRIRIGSYRVIYSVNNSIVTITIIKIGHRKSVYRH